MGKQGDANLKQVQISLRTWQLINELTTQSGISNKRLVAKLVTWFNQLGTSDRDRELRQEIYDVRDVDADEDRGAGHPTILDSLRLIRREVARIEQIENARKRH